MSSANEITAPGFAQSFVRVNDDCKLCYYANVEASKLSSTDGKPILLLLHGWPQSSYMWRYLAPMFSEAGYPVFVFDLPGYANSRDPQQTIPQDKLSAGLTILHALSSVLPTPSSPYPLALISHDRGARIAHRLAVSYSSSVASSSTTSPATINTPPGFPPSLSLKAVCLMDIVPTTVQYAAFASGREASTYFHWPFLANVSLATKLIVSFGGTRWVEEMTARTAGRNGQGLQRFHAGNAVRVYGAHFENEDVVRASCRDYEAGAGVDLEMQAEDQEKGRKVECPVLLVFSRDYLGSRFDVEGVWRREWVAEGVKVEAMAVGNGVGHYLAEEAPEEVGSRVLQWLKGL